MIEGFQTSPRARDRDLNRARDRNRATGTKIRIKSKITSTRADAAYEDDTEVVPPLGVMVAAVVPTAILRMAIGMIAATGERARRDARPYLNHPAPPGAGYISEAA